MARSWFEHSKDVQQKIHRDYSVCLSDEDMLHLTSLVIVIQGTIQRTNTGNNDHKTIFSRCNVTYIEKHIHEFEGKHNWKQCQFDKDLQILFNQKVEECKQCYEFDSHLQLLRLSRLRNQLFVACHIPSTQPRRSLLYDMAALFVMLRNESCREPNDVDMYLFFQVTFALIQLHLHNFIYLTNQTKNRYFTLWLMYFVEYSLDIALFWKDYLKIVPFTRTTTNETDATKPLKKAFQILTSMLFVRRQQIPDSCLHVSKHPDLWDTFVDQINQSYEVAKLRKEYSFSGFLFSLDVRRVMKESSI